MNEPESWSPEERQALDAWQVPDAPAGLAARAAMRASREARRWVRWASWAAAVAAVAAVTVVIAGWASKGERSVGAMTAMARTEVRLGDRGVAVVEPGGFIGWAVEGSGEAVVSQRGEVFYRVESGEAFLVRFPGGEVRVRGTCFGVRVEEGGAMRGALAGGVGAALGAGVTALVMVVVHEGRVEVKAAEGLAREVRAGERAEIVGGREVVVSERPAPVTGASEAGAADVGQPENQTGRPEAFGRDTTESTVARGECPTALASRDREVKALTAKVAVLEARMAEAEAAQEEFKSYGLSQERLVAMAKKCELAWDMIPLALGEPTTVPPERGEKFGLGDEQLSAINKLIAAESALVIAGIRAAYVEATGDDYASIMAIAPNALVEEIQDKTGSDEKQRVYKTLAAERAAGGIVAEGGASPFERVMRLLTTSGDRLEEKLGAAFGREEARRMRDAHHGFGNSFRSSYGCPGERPE